MCVFRLDLRLPDGKPLESPIHFRDLFSPSIPLNTKPTRFGKEFFDHLKLKPNSLPPGDAIYLTLPDCLDDHLSPDALTWIRTQLNMDSSFEGIPSYNEIRVETFLNNQIKEQQAKLLFSEEGLNIIIAPKEEKTAKHEDRDKVALVNFFQRFNFDPSLGKISYFEVKYGRNIDMEQVGNDHAFLTRILDKSSYPMSNAFNKVNFVPECRFFLSVEQYNWLKALIPTKTKDNKQPVSQNPHNFWSPDQPSDESLEKKNLKKDLKEPLLKKDLEEPLPKSNSEKFCIIS